MDAAEIAAFLDAAFVGPQWGLTDELWCMGMQKEPLALEQMVDQSDPTKVVSHPNQLGETKGFKECFNLYLQTDAKAKGVFGGNYFQTADTKRNDGTGICDASVAPKQQQLQYPMPISRQPMNAKNLDSGPEFVKLIRQARAALHRPDPKLLGESANTNADMFPTGIPFIFWEQYVDLIDELKEKLGYALAVSIATVTLLLFVLSPASGSLGMRALVAVWGSVVVNVFCIITVVEVYGFMGVAGIKLNAIPQVTLIMTMGIAVEFTAHTVLAYICAPALRGATYLESARYRTVAALNKMAVPTVHGSMTTFLGIVMISVSKSEFIRLYYFVLYSLIVLFGFLNGLVVLPALLVVAGPPATTTTTENAGELQVQKGSTMGQKADFGKTKAAIDMGHMEKALDVTAKV